MAHFDKRHSQAKVLSFCSDKGFSIDTAYKSIYKVDDEGTEFFERKYQDWQDLLDFANSL